MRGFITIILGGANPKLILEDGGEPFTFVEILAALQKAQEGIINMMAAQAANPAEEKKPEA